MWQKPTGLCFLHVSHAHEGWRAESLITQLIVFVRYLYISDPVFAFPSCVTALLYVKGKNTSAEYASSPLPPPVAPTLPSRCILGGETWFPGHRYEQEGQRTLGGTKYTLHRRLRRSKNAYLTDAVSFDMKCNLGRLQAALFTWNMQKRKCTCCLR